MKERPILFSKPMVNAILEDRKTQTRRVIKADWDWASTCRECGGTGQTYIGDGEFFGNCKTCQREPQCPYGKAGDRLWVRETFAPAADQWGAYEKWNDKFCSVKGDKPDIFYSADFKPYENDLGFTVSKPFIEKWKPSIHMPRWASRITLEITGVRVERLNDISEQDAKAEGIIYGDSYMTDRTQDDPRMAFLKLWESINGSGSWQQNPWVWVIEFKRVQP